MNSIVPSYLNQYISTWDLGIYHIGKHQGWEEPTLMHSLVRAFIVSTNQVGL